MGQATRRLLCGRSGRARLFIMGRRHSAGRVRVAPRALSLRAGCDPAWRLRSGTRDNRGRTSLNHVIRLLLNGPGGACGGDRAIRSRAAR